MMNRAMGFCGVALLLGGSVVVAGCSGSSAPVVGKTDASTSGDAGPACPASTKQCVTSSLARICPSDGSGWLPLACSPGETCTNGVCASDAGTACTPNAQQCLTSKIAESCPADGSGWLATGCTENQVCSGGACAANADAATTCPPSSSECVTSALVRVCPSDGSGWVGVTCQAGEVCSNGKCGFTPDAPCSPGTGTCTSSTTGFQCNAQGTAYVSVTCPANTTCSGSGVCTGMIVVGSSMCEGLSTIATSNDGFTYTEANCPTGKYCVSTGGNTAACLTGTCTPDPNGCDSVCGNKVTASANQTQYISTCTPGPNGYDWVANQCPTPTTCSPGSGNPCGPSNLPTPGCSGTCAPGGTRCAADGSGVQTCSTDGTTWGASVACNAAAGLVCGPTSFSGASCGDPVCFFGGGPIPGTCTSAGLFQACTSSYTLEPVTSATACPAGTTCEQTNAIQGAYQPGQCQRQCTPGATQCVQGDGGLTNLQTCTSGGAWGTTTTCAAGTTCNQNTSGVAVCGVCAPGVHRCTTSTGDAGLLDIETCSPTGAWSAPVACSVGTCQGTDEGDFACQTDCIPGATVCGGTNGAETGTCSASGTYPTTFTSCATGQSCRVDSNSNAIGCIQCLGPNHGLPTDQECTTTTAGQPGTAAIDTCGANDTWGPPVACAGTTTCSSAPAFCETVEERFGFAICGAPLTTLVTEANIEMATMCFGSNPTCQSVGLGAPEQCGVTAGCCASACSPAVTMCQ